VLVQVGTNEMLLDDARRLALRASDAEVDVVLDITANVLSAPTMPACPVVSR
jgi:acetyl esterase/lipase